MFLQTLIKIADRVTDSWSTRVGMNYVLQKYGEVTQLKIDRHQKTIDVQVQLRGETERVDVHVSRYEYDAREPEKLTLHGVTVSREWMDRMAKDFAEGKPLQVPGDVARYLPTVL